MGNLSSEKKSKIVIVSGATSEIGAETVKLFYENHYTVVCLGRDKKKLQQLQKKYDGLFVFEVDLKSQSQIKKLALGLRKISNKIDALVNIAGEFEMVSFLKLDDKKWSDCFEANVMTMVRLIRASYPFLKVNDGSSIVNVASSFGVRPPSYSNHYSLSKAVVINLTQSLALEFAPEKIRVNAVCPNFVLTKKNQKSEKLDNLREGLFPLKMASTAEDVANAIIFLTSQKSKTITGQSLIIDSGLLLKM